MAHLLALATSGRCLRFGFLTVVFPVAGIHIVFDVGGMGHNICNDPLFDGPAEEVELAHGGLFDWGLTADLEADALTATEGVEETLGVRLEFAFVMEMYHELAGGPLSTAERF